MVLYPELCKKRRADGTLLVLCQLCWQLHAWAAMITSNAHPSAAEHSGKFTLHPPQHSRRVKHTMTQVRWGESAGKTKPGRTSSSCWAFSLKRVTCLNKEF